MPKGRKKKSDRDEFEGRPAGLTFAAFLPESAVREETRNGEKNGTASINNKEDDSMTEMNDSTPEFTVRRTKKGKLPISYENRSKGKKVTVIANVSGNADALLAELKKRLGVGGVSRGTYIELQGNQMVYVEKFFEGHPCLK